MPLSPWEHYQQDLKKEGFTHDPVQENVVKHLQDLYERLIKRQSQEDDVNTGLFDRFKKRKPTRPEKGLYIWGGVGRGKTYLMDVFFESLPFEEKQRSHFHRFMRETHLQLKEKAGEKNPLTLIANDIAAKTRVICFDEFFVSDIADAMILGELFTKLFNRGVSLVATSNIDPPNLYKDGLQRARFLPAIDKLMEHTHVLHVDSPTDYRLRTLEQAELYHYPLDAEADVSLRKSFDELSPAACIENHLIEMEGRQFPSRFCADDVVWFDFDVLCNVPRSQNDYIELAKRYHAVLLSNVPILNNDNEDQARRFINLVDEFYDRNVKLIISAAANFVEIYQGELLAFEFERTESRLLEMQSHEYLARPHRP